MNTTRIEKFYSQKEWEEYVTTFMENAAVEVSGTNVRVVTHKGRILGKSHPVGYWSIKERRSVARLTA